MKVNVWQLGYNTYKDFKLNQNIQCREQGYVLIDSIDNWEEKVWDLLNWSCWAKNKPEEVHSPLTHCNSDIILQIEGTNLYKVSEFVGFTEHPSLETAIKYAKQKPHEYWPFSDVYGKSGHYKVKYDKVYWADFDSEDWIEVTW